MCSFGLELLDLFVNVGEGGPTTPLFVHACSPVGGGGACPERGSAVVFNVGLDGGRHFPARDAGLPQPGPSRAAIAAASRLRAAAVDTAVPVIRGPWRCRFFFERCWLA